MYHFPIFLAVTVCLLFSNICFDTVCWLPVLASLMLISFSLVPHFSGFTTLWLHPFFFFSCILFLTICCSLLSFCHCFLLTLCREESFYCTVPITPVKREVEELDTIEENMKLGPPMTADGGSSPMVKPKGDKQVEYLDLDLDSGKSTPPRKMKSNGTGMAASDERVDYVVVDQQRTQALKSTREAWNDGRQSTETDTPSKGPKWPCCPNHPPSKPPNHWAFYTVVL